MLILSNKRLFWEKAVNFKVKLDFFINDMVKYIVCSIWVNRFPGVPKLGELPDNSERRVIKSKWL